MKTGTSLGLVLIEEEGDNLVIRKKNPARFFVFTIFFTPGFLVFALLLWLVGREELKTPGDCGRWVLTDKLAFLQLDPASPAVRVGSVAISVFCLLGFAIIVLTFVGLLASPFLRGFRPRILDRSQRLLSRGRKPICSFNDDAQLVISSFRFRNPRDPPWSEPPATRSFVVFISPCLAHWRLIRERVLLGLACWLFRIPLCDDGFVFHDEASAHQFAHILGNYLGFPVFDLSRFCS
jgi:hypothetical protein